MLIEYRCYTLQPQVKAAQFWLAQHERGDTGLAPILQRAIGCFSHVDGPGEQIVGLYRYDDFADWQARLLGLPANAALQPYFRAVRPLIARQQNKFLVPSPLPELTPHWGNEHDWLPVDGPLLGVAGADARVEETRITLPAGGAPAFWQAAAQHGLAADAAFMDGLLGAFHTIAGPLNQLLLLRHFSDAQAQQAGQEALRDSAAWQGVLKTLAPMKPEIETLSLQPAPLRDMAPMFAGG